MATTCMHPLENSALLRKNICACFFPNQRLSSMANATWHFYFVLFFSFWTHSPWRNDKSNLATGGKQSHFTPRSHKTPSVCGHTMFPLARSLKWYTSKIFVGDHRNGTLLHWWVRKKAKGSQRNQQNTLPGWTDSRYISAWAASLGPAFSGVCKVPMTVSAWRWRIVVLTSDLTFSSTVLWRDFQCAAQVIFAQSSSKADPKLLKSTVRRPVGAWRYVISSTWSPITNRRKCAL